ncbi:hypothetical protein KAJ02_12320, partial [Candidatus Bipolaricaulota bacterium]|nr:hypothetical protein [Candidatus Bipolaricaulota bacterium]
MDARKGHGNRSFPGRALVLGCSLLVLALILTTLPLSAGTCKINITSNPSNGAVVFIYDVDDALYVVNGDDVDSYNNIVPCGHEYDVWVEKAGVKYNVKNKPRDWTVVGGGLIANGVADSTEPIHFELACSTPTVNAGSNDTICAGDTASLSGSAADYESVLWTTSGSGSFSSASSLSTTYSPSSADISAGSVTLTLTAYAESPCTEEASDAMVLTIVAL